MKVLLKLNSDDGFIESNLKSGKLEETYLDIQNGLNWIETLEGFMGKEYSDLISATGDYLRAARQKIILKYLDYFSENAHVGDDPNSFKADFVILLGSNNPEILKSRVERFAEVIPAHPRATVIVSGAGRWEHETEAESVRSGLMQMFPDRVIHKEEDSLDTVGNAVFTKLLIRSLGLTPENKNLLIVTSDFHAIRTLHIFKKVYDPGTTISVTGSKTQVGQEQLIKLSLNELNSGNTSSASIFRFAPFNVFQELDTKIPAGSDRDIFYQLIIRHDMYRNRFDLLRKYKQLLKPCM